MLVSSGPNNTLRLIRQPDHAAMAGELGARWHRPAVIPSAMWPRLIEAVRYHDIGWHEAEAAPALDEHGRPHSFKTLPLYRHVAIWHAGVAEMMKRDRYVGLLVALHVRWLYNNFMHPGEDTEPANTVQTLVNELDQKIDLAIEALQVGKNAEQTAVQSGAVTAAQRLVGALDGLSLMLCGALPFGTFPLPVRFGRHCKQITLSEGSSGTTISPWPFIEKVVTVHVTAKDVPDRSYIDSADLARVMEATEPTPLSFTLVSE